MDASPRMAVLLVLAACGRIGFDPIGSADATDSTSQPQTYREVVLADGPAGYWRLGETSGTVAHDETGTTDGTYSGGCQRGVPGALAGDPDPAVTFDGDTCQVDLGDHFPFLGMAPFSVEAWVTTVAVGDLSGSTFQHVFTHETRNGGPIDGFALAFCEGGPFVRGLFLERVVEGLPHGEAGRFSSDPVFVHVVGVYDGTDVILYIDGAESARMQAQGSLPSYAVSAYIGSGPDPANVTINYFSGVIDEVAIYARALTLAEIIHHHTVGIGN